MDETDINVVKLRGTVADVFYMKTNTGSDRLAFTLQILSDFVDKYGASIKQQNFVTCVAWWTAALKFKDLIQVWTRLQTVGELIAYTCPSKKDPTIILRKNEIRTKLIEVLGHNPMFVSLREKQPKVEFGNAIDDFSDLD